MSQVKGPYNTEESITNDIWLDEDDHLWALSNDRDERDARIKFDMCVSSSQMKDIRESDTWIIDSIHPRNNSVEVYLKRDI
jgi:hypothetical protein